MPIPGIWIVILQLRWTRTTGAIHDTGDELMRPVSDLLARLNQTHRLQDAPPLVREIQQQSVKLISLPQA